MTDVRPFSDPSFPRHIYGAIKEGRAIARYNLAALKKLYNDENTKPVLIKRGLSTRIASIYDDTTVQLRHFDPKSDFEKNKAAIRPIIYVCTAFNARAYEYFKTILSHAEYKKLVDWDKIKALYRESDMDLYEEIKTYIERMNEQPVIELITSKLIENLHAHENAQACHQALGSFGIPDEELEKCLQQFPLLAGQSEFSIPNVVRTAIPAKPAPPTSVLPAPAP